jgi:putative flippase GtrA
MTRFDQIARFGFVGILATAVHVSVGMGLNAGAGVAQFWANLVAFCCALGVSFLGQTRLTFPGSSAGRGAFARFTLVAVTGLCLNQTIVWLVTSVIGAPYWLALAIIVATVPAATFCLLKFWALRH